MTFLALVVIAGVYNPLSHTRHCFDLLTASNKYLSYIGSVKKYILCYQILCSNFALITNISIHQFNAFTEPDNMIIRSEVTCYKAKVAKNQYSVNNNYDSINHHYRLFKHTQVKAQVYIFIR